MLFRLNKKMARELFIRDRIPAIRFLRDTFDEIGICPDLHTCRDIVDRIKWGDVVTTDVGENTFIVRID